MKNFIALLYILSFAIESAYADVCVREVFEHNGVTTATYTPAGCEYDGWEKTKVMTDPCRVKVKFNSSDRQKGTLAICEKPYGKGRKAYYKFKIDDGYFVTAEEYEKIK